MHLSYTLLVDPASYQQARYALETLLDGIGLWGEATADVGAADLVYAAHRPEEMAPDAVWIQAERLRDWNNAALQVGWLDTMPVLYHRQRPEPGSATRSNIRGDLLFSTYALLTGLFEAQLPQNPWGIPLAKDSVLRQGGLIEWPVVALYTDYLSERLRRRFGKAWDPFPRWPEGKKYAIVLSHDVDRPFLHPSLSFYSRRMKKDLRQGALWRMLRGGGGMARTALLQYTGRMPTPDQDPNFCFAAWRAVEGRLDATSCFYVAVTNAADPTGDFHDVGYDYANPFMVRQMREAIDSGWEIGLHASINARRDPARFQEERRRLESVLDGYAVKGVRHHHWSLDPRRPESTWRAHAEAGFLYDSSLGLNDAPGFRRGMVWPFLPFDRDHAEVLPLLQVPPTLMDGGIYYHDVEPEDAIQQMRTHFARVFSYGGAAVLDWHLEQLNPNRLQGAGPALMRVLADLSTDNDIYWASPLELAEWWKDRRARIKARGVAKPPTARGPILRRKRGLAHMGTDRSDVRGER